MKKIICHKKIFKITIDDVGIEYINSWIDSGSGFRFIVTPNVQHIIEIYKNEHIFECYKKASLTFCDSKIVQMFSKLLHNSINNVVPGSDLTKYLFTKYFCGDEKIMILGSTNDDIATLKERFNLSSLHHYSPPMGFIDTPQDVEKTIEEVLKVGPRFLFVALGFPRQEMLACALSERVDFDCDAFCIGASIDFLTGKQKRASQVWQTFRLEWLYRFSQEPKRLFKRYFIDGWKIIPILFKELRIKKD